jgi:hypothetical protein
LDLALILDPEQFKCLYSSTLAKAAEENAKKGGAAQLEPDVTKDSVEHFFHDQYLRQLVSITKHCPEHSRQLLEMAHTALAYLGPEIGGAACQLLISETQ